MAKIAALRLGSPVCFDDRWKGKVTALDVTEQWTVQNVAVSAGSFFSQQTVKLPITAVKSIIGDALRFNGTSVQAFAREIPPIASPARPVSVETPISNQNMRFAGFVVDTEAHYSVEEVLVSRGQTTYRVALDHVQFEGKTLMFTSTPDDLPQYYFDGDVLDQIKRNITEDRTLTGYEKMRIEPSVDGGVVGLSGNIFVATTRPHLQALVGQVPGVVSIRDEVADDFEIETAIGLALQREGLAHQRVWARASLGDVIVGGSASSQRNAEDISRAAAKVRGVRKVSNRLTVNSDAVISAPSG